MALSRPDLKPPLPPLRSRGKRKAADAVIPTAKYTLPLVLSPALLLNSINKGKIALSFANKREQFLATTTRSIDALFGLFVYLKFVAPTRRAPCRIPSIVSMRARLKFESLKI